MDERDIHGKVEGFYATLLSINIDNPHNATLMAENPYKHHHFPGEELTQTWAADRDFQKVEKEAEEHRTKSTFPIEWPTNLKMAAYSMKPMYASL